MFIDFTNSPTLKQLSFYFILFLAIISIILGFVIVFNVERDILQDNTKKTSSNIFSYTLLQFLSQDIPYFQITLKDKELSLTNLFFKNIIGINLNDPRTFLSLELPFFNFFDTEITAASADIDYTFIPVESPFPKELEKDIIKSLKEKEEYFPVSNLEKVFIYHTHFWESYIPELVNKKGKKKVEKTNDLKKNITLVGRYMALKFQRNGIGSIVSKKSCTDWKKAYKSSKKNIIEALKKNDNLEYFIDLHRDSSRRKYTTLRSGDKTYARLSFVLGEQSKFYYKNKRLSEEVCSRVNKKVKGLCKAVFTKKKTKNSHGEYNQSISPRSMLIEVGGVDNTFLEAYRSIDVLVDVLTNIIKSNK